MLYFVDSVISVVLYCDILF